MIKAHLYEVSPVLVGAVPGTKTLAVRSPKHEHMVKVLDRLVSAGSITRAEARRLVFKSGLSKVEEEALEAEAIAAIAIADRAAR